VYCPFLVGPTIYLRPLEVGDAQTIAPWFNDAEVRGYLRRYYPMSVTREEEWLRGLYEGPRDIAFGIALRADDRLIGGTGLHDIEPRHRHACFGISIGDKSLWGKGHGTEATGLVLRYAFHTLNLNRVWLHVFEYNPRAARVYEKVGFRCEGRLRQDAFHDGRYWDTIVMGILRGEWEALNAPEGPAAPEGTAPSRAGVELRA
jgi:RimJ/RimL family protein N-acetyltransferase